MALELVAEMDQSPSHCFICMTRPMGRDGEFPSVRATEVDVDWGDTPYICVECGEIIAKLFGHVTKDIHDEVKAANRTTLHDLHQAQNELAQLQEKHATLRADHSALRRAVRGGKRKAA